MSMEHAAAIPPYIVVPLEPSIQKGQDHGAAMVPIQPIQPINRIPYMTIRPKPGMEAEPEPILPHQLAIGQPIQAISTHLVKM